MKKSESIGSKLVPAVIAILLAVVWQVIVDSGLVPRFVLPSPVDVLKAFVQTMPVMCPHIAATLKEAMIGFTFSVALSLALAILMDTFSPVRKALYPLLVVSQTIPIIALAPLFVMWFGFGMLPKVIVVVLVCFFPIVISLLEGLGSVDIDMLNLLKSMGASKLQIFRLVKLPASMVGFFSGLRISAAYSIMGAVIGEWLGGDKGIGFYMLRVKHSFAVDKVFAAILVIVILSMLLFKVIAVLQDMAIPWYRHMKNEK